MVGVRSFYILMCLKKHFPLSDGALIALSEDSEEDPGRVISGDPSNQPRKDLGSLRSLWPAAGTSLEPLKPSLGGSFPEASLLLLCPAAGLTTASFPEQPFPGIREGRGKGVHIGQAPAEPVLETLTPRSG